ncbi:AAC(3)-I family aminoglycoside N-acetyltransferase [Rhabdaerophilum sp. SD176]|uniref:AAC(3)-I family aminoglycoside N-acetyltransferase n=1 Tax=Rhabdaerophilum sp. SD176 TaxID=2983548 RepID=UPI0024DFDCB3|nr:AAC(3)-I family aminoglycoside N-acetyltransferase [Rhabdaerophilum sp. SD176]
MPDWTIRRLAPGDEAGFDAMLDLFADAFEDRAAYGDRRPGSAWRDSLLANPDFVALVAEQDGAVVGALAAYFLQKFEQERREAYLYDLAVSARARRQGIATGLIEALKPIARAGGAHVIFVQADLEDDPAIALYARLGRREDVLHFDIPV